MAHASAQQEHQVYSAAVFVHYLRILHNIFFNELIKILSSLYVRRFEVSGTFSFQRAPLSRSFMVSLRLISSSSRLDSNCLWVRTGLVPPVATCLCSSGHSLGLRHKRKGWRPPENNIYPGALVRTSPTPILCLSLCRRWWVLSQNKDPSVSGWLQGFLSMRSLPSLMAQWFCTLPQSLCATAKGNNHSLTVVAHMLLFFFFAATLTLNFITDFFLSWMKISKPPVVWFHFSTPICVWFTILLVSLQLLSDSMQPRPIKTL